MTDGDINLTIFFLFSSFQYLKPPTVDFKRAKKMKGKGGSANTAKVKKIVKNAKKKVSDRQQMPCRTQFIDVHSFWKLFFRNSSKISKASNNKYLRNTNRSIQNRLPISLNKFWTDLKRKREVNFFFEINFVE